MSFLQATAFVAFVLFLIMGCGWLVQRPMKVSVIDATKRELSVRWFFIAFVIWIVALAAPNTPVTTFPFLVLGGPIAFFFGLTFTMIRVRWNGTRRHG